MVPLQRKSLAMSHLVPVTASGNETHLLMVLINDKLLINIKLILYIYFIFLYKLSILKNIQSSVWRKKMKVNTFKLNLLKIKKEKVNTFILMRMVSSAILEHTNSNTLRTD